MSSSAASGGSNQASTRRRRLPPWAGEAAAGWSRPAVAAAGSGRAGAPMSVRRLLGEQVAQAAQRVDRHPGALELLAQARDVDLDRLHTCIGIEIEHLLEQRLARHRKSTRLN